MDADATPEASSPRAADAESTLASGSAETGNQQTSNAKLRKRTKTGCLTCRRRRIKCGEERPICTNCVKSKRQCEGYNQRLVFKTALEGWPGMIGPASIIPHHTSVLPRGSRPEYPVDYTYLGEQTHYGIPIDQYGRPIHYSPQQVMNPGHPTDYPQQQVLNPGWPPTHYPTVHAVSGDGSLPMATFSSVPPTPTSIVLPPPPDYLPANDQLQSPGPLISPYYQDHSFHQFYDGLSPQSHDFPSVPNALYTPTHPSNPPTHVPATYSGDTTYPGSSSGADYFSALVQPSVQHVVHHSIPMTSSVEGQAPGAFRHKPGISRNFTGAPIAVGSFVPPSSTHYVVHPRTHNLETAAVEWQHGEYESPWDPDEDVELSTDVSPNQTQHNDEALIQVMEVGGVHLGKSSTRDYNAFLYSGFMTTYDAEKFASPLKNPHTARVFAHFLASTASAISIFDRAGVRASRGANHDANFSARGLWTYIMPTMALSHQGLLHAMLSLSSLQISKLQNDTPTPAFKHYGYAIKRVNKCVQHPGKRHNLTTLAATLLLGFYEVMTADHTKWCCHLSGAARLLQEIDFAGMTKQARAFRSQQMAAQGIGPAAEQHNDESHVALNYRLIRTLVGREPMPAQFGGLSAMPFDLRRYDIFQDMFWWYARQDVYQSILAGNRLMLKFYRWLDCPPRAAVGRFDAIYGTHDHIFLLLGRIADFSAKDRERKLDVMSANGGAWRPPTSNAQKPPPATMQPRTHNASARLHPSNDSGKSHAVAPPTDGRRPTGPPMPSFYGLIPMPTNVSIPAPYSEHFTMPPLESPVAEKSGASLDAQTQAALQDWQQMYGALHQLKAHFGAAFEPVEVAPQVPPSPFGTVIRYASHEIAVLWALYYAAHIVALRGHPHMPPFAHIAAGVAAAQTKDFSNIIGRIAAGMMSGPICSPQDPAVGAAYCEISMPLFIAGIQYTDAAQRQWLVDRTRETEQLSGWASVGMIGQGCERAWIKTAEAGMGPPYTPRAEESRVSDSSTMRVPRVGNGRPPTSQDHWRNHPDHVDPRGMRVHLAMGLLSNEGDLNAEEQAVRHARRLSDLQVPATTISPSLAFRPAP